MFEPPATFWHQNNVERSKAPQTRGRMCFFYFGVQPQDMKASHFGVGGEFLRDKLGQEGESR